MEHFKMFLNLENFGKYSNKINFKKRKRKKKKREKKNDLFCFIDIK